MKKRDCLDCVHWRVCFLYKDLEKVISGTQMLNIDGKSAPGTMTDIYQSLASACIEFASKEKGPPNKVN